MGIMRFGPRGRAILQRGAADDAQLAVILYVMTCCTGKYDPPDPASVCAKHQCHWEKVELLWESKDAQPNTTLVLERAER